MLEGLWSVEIMSPSGGLNAGVMVFQPRRVFGDFFEDGRILGGDRNYFYSGTYTVENHGVTGDFEVVHYADDTHPSFGPDKKFRMKISGKLDRHVNRDVLQFSGYRVDTPDDQLSLRLTRRV
ncbi:MAG: hypothetical protein ACE5LB_10655 [Acidiferrobacterales bacterium]